MALPENLFREYTLTPSAAIIALSGWGIVPTHTRGECKSLSDSVTLAHDGVPYCASFKATFGVLNQADALETLNRRALVIERHHARIRAGHRHLEAASEGPVWVSCQSGPQLKVAFGNTLGFMAFLSLDFANLEDQHRLSSAGYDEGFTLNVHSKHNNEYLETFTYPGITVIPSEEGGYVSELSQAWRNNEIQELKAAGVTYPRLEVLSSLTST